MTGSSANKDGSGLGRLRLALVAVAVLVVIAVGAVYLSRTIFANGAPAAGLATKAEGEFARFAQGEMDALITHARPVAAPRTTFEDPQRRSVTLADFKGEVVVVNLWATWCKPCLTEMPTLDAVQQAYAGKGLKVLAVNVDLPEKYADAKDFIGVHPALELYHDPANIQGLYQALDGKGLPITVVYDRRGREVARLTGGANWNSPEARAFFDAVLAAR